MVQWDITNGEKQIQILSLVRYVEIDFQNIPVWDLNRRTRRPIWGYYVCLKNFRRKVEQNLKITPDAPKIKVDSPVLHDNNGKTIRQIWVNSPLPQVGPSNPVPEQSQVKVPGELIHVPPLHGKDSTVHSSISRKNRHTTLHISVCFL